MEVSLSSANARASQPRDRHQRFAWYVYDWANASFSIIVVTVFLGPYLTSVAHAAADAAGYVHFLGIPIVAGSVFPFAVSLSALLQIGCLPLLGALADYSNRKKDLLVASAAVGVVSTIGLFFVQGTAYLLGAGLFVLANLAYGAASAFYNAYLPDVASPQERNAVSSIGWSIGYIGGGILLALNLALFSNANNLGLSAELAVRIALASAGIWWALFGLYPLFNLHPTGRGRALPPGESYLLAGVHQLGQTLSRARRFPQVLLFLAAYLMFNDGIQTVIALSSQFGQEELGLGVSTLTTVILAVQFVAFVGAMAFRYLADAIGTRNAILTNLTIWTMILVYAFGFLYDAAGFWILGLAVGLVLGGSRALSRAAFSLMIPRGDESEYFSLYEVGDHGTTWIGPLFFGLALQFTHSYRVAIISLVVFFAIGSVLLSRVDLRQAALQVGNEPPHRP